ncbi:MAG: WGR domain-containing protein [Caulobacteraceae bacterium]
MTLLHRRDPLTNLARFYAVTIERSLFDEFVLVRLWGRIGTHGRRRSEAFPSEAEAMSASDHIVQTKRRRGYSEPSQIDE